MKPVCTVLGVGPGNGAAFARRFASEGYTVALLARTTELSGNLASSLPDARAYACDVTDAGSIERAFDAIRRDLGEVQVLVYNAGSGVWGSIEEATSWSTAWSTCRGPGKGCPTSRTPSSSSRTTSRKSASG